ncbi:unnamed protein product [Linum trigynum]|uniref:Uncharacterized protein n=1 Tax=Linum trigynum TaxID=586398 RepID=A0AAV2G6G3_9ROSI
MAVAAPGRALHGPSCVHTSNSNTTSQLNWKMCVLLAKGPVFHLRLPLPEEDHHVVAVFGLVEAVDCALHGEVLLLEGGVNPHWVVARS